MSGVFKIHQKVVAPVFTVSTGATSSSFPRVGLGTWKSSPADAVKEVVYESIKAGYRHIDCAAVYGNEQHVGAGMKQAFDEGICKREDLWITSKLWNTHHAKENVKEACARTLKDLGVDYIDLYLIHFPMPLKYVSVEERYPAPFFSDPADPQLVWSKVPLSETWKAMEALVDQKLVRHLGVSNFQLQLLQDLMTYCRIHPINIQIELHPYFPQTSMVKFCTKHNISVTAYSPFGGKSYTDLGMTDENELHVLDHPELKSIAARLHKSVAQVVLRWILQLSPVTVVIPKSVSTTRMAENFALYDFSLTDDDMTAIAKINSMRRYNDANKFTDQHDSYWPIFE